MGLHTQDLQDEIARLSEINADLLEACETLLEAELDALTDGRGCKCSRCVDARKLAMAAIDKAKGESCDS